MKKKNILLLHGALGSKAQLSALKLQLSNSFNVLDLNFAGHGGRAVASAFSMELFADNVLQYLKKQQIERTAIFGYSMGGYVGLQFALQHPEMVEEIVTLGTKFAWSEAIAEREVKMLNPVKIREKVPAFAKRLEDVHGSENWEDVVRKTAGMMAELGAGKKMMDAELSRIEHKVLIGIGALDQMVTVEESEHAAGILSSGNLQVIEGFKHPFEKIEVEILAKMIIEFAM